MARLFDALTVERGADGGIRIEAPPHAARALVSLLDGMARLLGAVSGDRDQPEPAQRDDHRIGLLVSQLGIDLGIQVVATLPVGAV